MAFRLGNIRDFSSSRILEPFARFGAKGLECIFLLFVLSRIPSSGVGPVTLRFWEDQSLYLNALEEIKTGNPSAVIDSGSVGPGYVFLAALFGRISGDTAQGILLLNQFSIYSVIVTLYLAIRGSRSFFRSLVILFIILICLDLLFVRDIPWTHFTWTAIFLILFSLSEVNLSPQIKAFIYAPGLLLLWQIRMYETAVVLVALLLVYCYSSIFRRERFMINKSMFLRLSSCVGVASISFTLTSFLIGRQTGVFYPWFQYRDGGIPLDFDLSSLLNRFVQVLYLPNYLALDSTIESSGYFYFERVVNPDSLARWFAPLAQQQPLLIPLVLFALTTFAFLFKPRTNSVSDYEKPYMMLLLLAALGIFIGYFLNPIMGSGHLHYGIMREFIAPQVLILYVMLRKSFSLSRRGTKSVIIGLLFTIYLLSLPLLQEKLPKETFSSYNFFITKIISDRNSEEFDIVVKIKNQNGKEVDYEGYNVYMYQACDEEKIGFVTNRVRVPLCKGERSLSILPTVFGIGITPEGERILIEMKKDLSGP